jgi:tripartite-type tricarboxylate transporter receptor subunit TctC
MRLSKQTLGRGLLATLGLLVMSGAAAQTYPSKPITLILPFPPGGLADATVRAIAPEMEKPLGQPLIIDNRPGGNGAIGVAAIARAAPDGYTAGFTNLGAIVILPAVQKNLPYDASKDLAPVGLVFETPLVWAVKTSSPIRTLKDLVAHAKANPGKLSFGLSGAGGTPHLIVELLKDEAGIDVLPVPYKGEAPAFTDFLGGRIDVSTAGYGNLEPHLKSGAVRIIAQLGPERSPLYPDIPTARESGFPRVAGVAWLGFNAPAATPRESVAKLSQALATAVRTPVVRERLARQYTVPVGSTPEQYGQFLREENARWTPILKRLDLKFD